MQARGFVTNCDQELKRAMILLSVIHECQNMKEFYEEIFKSEPARLAPWLGQGIFTPDFLCVMIICAPHQEMMGLAVLLPRYHFYDQMTYFSTWVQRRVDKVLHIKNMCITLNPEIGGKVQQQKAPESLDKLLARKAKQLVFENIRKHTPQLEQIDQPSRHLRHLNPTLRLSHEPSKIHLNNLHRQ